MNACLRTLSVSQGLIKSVISQQSFFSSYTLVSNGISVPRKDKKRGEDAYFINDKCIGVADGVGGWATCGVDPGEFSRKLVEQVSKNLWTPVKNENDFKQQITKSVDYTISEIPKGSSTLCTLCCGHDKSIYLYNIGDSGLFQYRYGVNPKDVKESTDKEVQPSWYIVYASDQQLHGFNFPAQLGKQGDHPDSGKIEKLDIQKNDLILMGTDGLFDNLFHNVITSLINTTNNVPVTPENISLYLKDILTTIVNTAVTSSESSNLSPFEYSAGMAGYKYKGGKPDDITCVLTLVQ